MAQTASTRRERERDIVEATRALFDERGLQDAPIDEIARAVGINKALIYRVFASKEELFVLTAASYLDELRAQSRNAGWRRQKRVNTSSAVRRSVVPSACARSSSR